MKDMHISEHVRAHRDMERLRNSSAEFTAQQDLEGLLECLEQYIRDMGLEYFYLCLCGNVDGHSGREALSERNPAIKGTYYQNFILNLDNALEMIRRQNMLRRLQQGFDPKD